MANVYCVDVMQCMVMIIHRMRLFPLLFRIAYPTDCPIAFSNLCSSQAGVLCEGHPRDGKAILKHRTVFF
jgi:hypothetical protein